MADATEVALAKAIVLELNDASRSWHSTFSNAARSWSPWNGGADLASLVVYVLPMTIPASKRESRGQPWVFEYGIAIDFQQEVAINSTTGLPTESAVDTLCGVVEAVQDFYRDNHVILSTSTGDFYAKEVERPQIFVPERLFAEHVFESWVELTVRGYR